jgi:NAD(P)-dependent dehydrogenase (short-subunit alcohol dehydrogenase family)
MLGAGAQDAEREDMTNKPLKGKAALVTGASRGIGVGIAQKLAEAGADLLLSARSMDDLETTATMCREYGVRAETIYMDAYDLESVYAAVDAVTERFGKIDILVNNAGGSRNVEGGWQGFMASTPEMVRGLFELNLISPYFAAHRAAEAMIRQGSGVIINITSPLAHYPSDKIQPYSAAKCALDELTKLWAVELGPKGIRVNAIAPGPIESAQLEKIRLTRPDYDEQTAKMIPLGRIGRPDEVGAAAVFLASDDAEWITGASLLVTGGRRG